MTRWKKIWSWTATGLFLLGVFFLVALRWWNMFGQSGFGAHCRWTGGCKSFYCLRHELRDGVQVKSRGYCTKGCSSDASCASAGLSCVKPGGGAKSDLPPFGKPSKLCMRVIASAPPVTSATPAAPATPATPGAPGSGPSAPALP